MLLKLFCLWLSGRALAQHIARSWVRSTALPENGSTVLLFVLVAYPVPRLIYQLNSTAGTSASEEACCTEGLSSACTFRYSLAQLSHVAVASALEKQQWRFDHCTKFSWIELLWRKYLVLYSWGGLYHLDSLGLWDLISGLWEKFICIWLVLPPNSKDPSLRVHFRDVKQVYTSGAVELLPGIQRLTLWVRTHGKTNSWQYVSRRGQRASPTLLTYSTTNCTCTFHYPVDHRPLCGLKWWE